MKPFENVILFMFTSVLTVLTLQLVLSNERNEGTGNEKRREAREKQEKDHKRRSFTPPLAQVLSQVLSPTQLSHFWISISS